MEVISRHYYEDGSIKREFYYKDKMLHREDGPAFIWYNEDGSIRKKEYFLNDIEVKDDFQLMVIQALENSLKENS